jgi:fatty-acyl-CoA synthase
LEASVAEVLERGAAHDSAAVITAENGERIPLRDLLAQGQRVAAVLLERGVQYGDRVGLIIENDFGLFTALFGIIYAGAVAVPLAPMAALGGVQAYLVHLRSVATDAEIRHITGGRRVLDKLRRTAGDEALGVDLIAVDTLTDSESRIASPAEGSSLALIQYTSGSTTSPRGVMLTHRNIVAGIDAIQRGCAATASDAVGLWIPLFHDMGLFSALACLGRGGCVVLWRPSSFIRKPGLWLKEFLAAGCTILAAPNFCFDYLVAERNRVPEDLDLSQWRLAFNGAEPIDLSTVEQFQRVFGECGFRPEAMFPVYGLAEATLAVTFPELGTVPRVLWVDRNRLTATGYAEPAGRGSSGARPLVSVGRSVPGMSVRIGGADASEGFVGEVEIAGPSVTTGYYGRPTGELFTRDRWLRTGDLGFFRQGEMYITGRVKDVINIRGASYFAEDAETIVRDLPGIYRKRCAAVPVSGDGDGSESLAIVAETTATSPDDRNSLTRLIKSEVSAGLGLADVAVHLVSPRTLPQTSSGKIQRARVRAALCAGRLLQHTENGP